MQAASKSQICIAEVLFVLGHLAGFAVAAGYLHTRDFTRVAIVPLAEGSGLSEREGWGDGVAELVHNRLGRIAGGVAFKPSELPDARASLC